MRTHTVAAAEFHDLAAGFGTAQGVRALRAAQVDRRLLMLREVLRSVRPGSPAEAAYELFCAAQRHAGEAVAEVVAAPHFGAWVTAALRELRAVPAELPAPPALPYLGNLAVSAAVRAGLDFAIELTADDGVFRPGLGHAARGRSGPVPVRGTQGRYTVADAELPADLSTDAANWSALRVISAEHDGCGIRLVLDDLDPYRDMHRLNAGGRLTGAAVRRWAEVLGEAWPQLVRRHRRYAEAIAAGLTTVVPLTPPDSGHGINATVMHAFGAVSLTPPKDGLGLAASLLHEFQHAKLGALLALLPMYEDSGARRFYAPWRDDPVPWADYSRAPTRSWASPTSGAPNGSIWPVGRSASPTSSSPAGGNASIAACGSCAPGRSSTRTDAVSWPACRPQWTAGWPSRCCPSPPSWPPRPRRTTGRDGGCVTYGPTRITYALCGTPGSPGARREPVPSRPRSSRTTSGAWPATPGSTSPCNGSPTRRRSRARARHRPS